MDQDQQLTQQQQQKVWSQVFYWINHEGEPSMEWPQAKYIIYTKFTDKYQRPKIIGYVQFCAPIQTDMLSTINPAIQWTDQRFSNSACIRYIEKINIQENGQLITLGEHWPVKPFARQQENTETLQPELKKKTPTRILKKPHAYQQQPVPTLWTQQPI